MLFNSVQFAIFFFLVLGSYWLLGHKQQNKLLLTASYIFYGSWDWRFLLLLFISTTFDYWVGRGIQGAENQSSKKVLLIGSIIVNLSFLGFFKYFNFFADNFVLLLNQLGLHPSAAMIKIILPVGISFYTFQSMSYTIGVYRKELQPCRDFMDFALYVSFFPQLVAGPIERAKHLLPQVQSPRTRISYEAFREGCYLILWGLFQKVLIADNLVKIVDLTFILPAPYSGSQVILAVYAFAFQIYGDFAGYSNMARGIAKLIGFDLMVNFNFPYLAQNPREFWQRWHISLSTWLRDYLYIPLGGNQNNSWNTCRNLMLTMFLGGLWHGAAWTFVVWGLYQGALLVLHRILSPSVRIGKIFSRILMFHLVCLGWLVFRANSMEQAWSMFLAIFMNFNPAAVSPGLLLFNGLLIMALLLYEYPKYARGKITWLLDLHWFPRWCFYLFVFHVSAIIIMKGARQFIYFQF